MARYGAAPAAQTQEITASIMEGLRLTVPQLMSATRAFGIRYVITIRNGTADRMDQFTWDEWSKPIHHVNAGECQAQLRKIEGMLLRDLPTKIGDRNMHGEVHLTVTVKNQTVAFSTEQKRQRLFTWRQDGTSVT